MILHHWGEVDYEEGYRKMLAVHKKAKADGENHLILTSHPPCFTIGRNVWDTQWSVPVIRSDRGGSITCHSSGQNIYYFCFQAPNPPLFFKKVRTVFTRFFAQFDKPFYYDKNNPGFYIENRKICSLGFRYKKGVSLHGVALNIDVDLSFHNQVNPCNLQNIQATSFKAEDIHIDCEWVNNMIISETKKVFHEVADKTL